MSDPIAAFSRLVRSPAFKLALIAVLILLLGIPLLIVHGLIGERENRARDVRSDVGRTWGPEQRLIGPLLVVPYTVKIETVQGDRRIEQLQERRAIFTPVALQISGTAASRTLRRSIFEVPVYTSRLKLAGRFLPPRITDAAGDAIAVKWREASVVIGLSGVSGLKESAVLKLPGAADIPFSPSLGMPNMRHTGIHARLETAGEAAFAGDQGIKAFDLSVELAFNGSLSLEVAPVAQETRMALSSDWRHPSFSGAFLPDERTISAEGFAASWRIPHLARSVPEAWSATEAGIERLSPFAFGVRFVEPVDFYSLVNRATKYGLMFLTLVFMAVFCLELIDKRPVHPVQYVFTGIALVFFFVLLLSLAEHIGFGGAYLVAATANSAMLAAYVGAALGKRRSAGIIFAVLVVTYALLYLVLRLEDYALLAGALLGFVALTFVMFATLRVDWSGGKADAPSPSRSGAAP